MSSTDVAPVAAPAGFPEGPYDVMPDSMGDNDTCVKFAGKFWVKRGAPEVPDAPTEIARTDCH